MTHKSKPAPLGGVGGPRSGGRGKYLRKTNFQPSKAHVLNDAKMGLSVVSPIADCQKNLTPRIAPWGSFCRLLFCGAGFEVLQVGVDEALQIAAFPQKSMIFRGPHGIV